MDLQSISISRPALNNDQTYIYIIENTDEKNNYIKIGQSKNPAQRFRSLSGSNGGGSKLTGRYVISPATYLYNIENLCHIHFDKYRIEGTEWFRSNDEFTFEIAREYLKLLFSSADYNKCNNLRKQIVDEINKKEIKEKKDESNK